MEKVRDRLWIWGHAEGSHNDAFNLPAHSRMTPAEAAFYMNVPNLLMVVYGERPEPPFDQLAVSFRPLNKVIWSIIGYEYTPRNLQYTDLNEVIGLSRKFPNIQGAIMDDFFMSVEDGKPGEFRYSVEDVRSIRKRLHSVTPALDLWVVLYNHELNLPVQPYLKECDVITFWTWTSDKLVDMEENFALVEEMAPDKPKVLGCYLWDYGAGQPMSLERMQYQCEKGLAWLKTGRIEGMIFLASCICDLNLESVVWTRQWIAEVGEQPIN